MPNSTVTKIEAFFEGWSASLAELVSQLSSQPWTQTHIGAVDDYTPVAIMRVKLGAGLKGSLWLGAGPDDAALMLELFTGEKRQAIAPLDEMQIEALTELTRQWAGLTASQLKPTFGEVSLEVVLESGQPAYFMAGRLLRIASGERSLAIRVEMDAELLALFDRRQGSRPPLVSEPTAETLGQMLRDGNLDLLLDVELGVTLRFGSRRASLREVLELSPGAVLELNREIQEPVDLLLNDRVIARGDVVVVDGNYGLHIAEVISAEQRLRAL